MFSVHVHGQKIDVFNDIHLNTTNAYGVMRVGEFPANYTDVKPPKGYKPFYVSHYGRHGARWATSDKSYIRVYEKLSKAHNDGKLTELGKKIYNQYCEIYPNLIGHTGELTQKGQLQHRNIASVMAKSFPEIFKNAGSIEAESSISPRCILSMSAFCSELQRHYPKVDIKTQACPSDMSYISPYDAVYGDLLPADKFNISWQAPWRLGLENYSKDLINTDEFLAKLFTDLKYAKGLVDPLKLKKSFFAVMSGMDCLDFSSNHLFANLFTEEEIFQLWEVDNIVFYMMEGPGLPGNLRMNKYTWTLLQDIITKTDEDIASKKAARLRFGHDMTIMGFLSLLGIDSWGVQAKQLSDIKYTWQNYRVPMASNMQFIFYRSEKDSEILFKMFFNGKPQSLPFEAFEGSFYRWSDFKTFSANLLANVKKELNSPACSWMYDIPDKFNGRPMQAFSVNSGILFVCYDSGYCRTYRHRTGELLGEFKMGCFIPTNHCGNANFGNEYPEGNTEHPALYISGDLTNRACYVQSITRHGAKTVQTIKFDLNNNYGGSQAVIDTARQRIVYMQRKLKNIEAKENTFVINEFRLPKLNEKEVIFTDQDVLCTYELSAYFPIYQGACIQNGMLLQSYGFPKRQIGLAVFDLVKKELVENIDLSKVMPYEPQSVCIYKGGLYMNFWGAGYYRITNTSFDKMFPL